MAWSNPQGASNSSGSAALSSIAYATQNNTKNSLLTLGAMYIGTQTGTPSADLSLTDSKSNSWSKIISAWIDLSGNFWAYMGLFQAVNSNGTGGEKITVNVGNYLVAAASGLIIEEFTGNTTSSPVDVSGFVGNASTVIPYTTSTTSITGPQLATTVDGDLVYAITWTLQAIPRRFLTGPVIQMARLECKIVLR